MAKTLRGAFAQLEKMAWGSVVAKGGFEVGERVIAYVAFFTTNSNGMTDRDSHTIILRHDNGRDDLKEYKYCEVMDERSAWEDSPNACHERIMQELQFDWRTLSRFGN